MAKHYKSLQQIFDDCGDIPHITLDELIQRSIRTTSGRQTFSMSDQLKGVVADLVEQGVFRGSPNGGKVVRANRIMAQINSGKSHSLFGQVHISQNTSGFTARFNAGHDYHSELSKLRAAFIK
jgi:hypothetical protein